ncbi:MAG: PD40 domain-containing protein [Acidobacteria bacterium]|nr:PD40 domain-containing protein [Acidobacteriota bacterium]
MVTPHGHIKLLDFGIARVNTDAGLTQSGLTLPGDIPGTPQYMAPEQALGRPLDGRADLFALGVVLFRCLAGRLPFDGQTRDEYIQQMLAGRVQPLAELAPSTPPPVRDIVHACLRADPQDRPESALVVADTLSRAAEGLSTATLPVSAAPAAGLPRWALQLAGLLLLAGALALGAYKWPSSEGDSSVGGTLVPAVTWPSAEFDARISPDGAWLSFISDRDNQSRIFMQAIEGADSVPVTVQGAVLSHLWSPDGRELAAVVRQGDDKFVMIVPAFFGGSPRVSAPLDRELNQAYLRRWIGNAIYLEVDRGKPTQSLIRLDVPSGKLEDISAQWMNGPIFRSVDVSPGGTRIVMDANVGGQSDLWTSHLDGSNRERLTSDASVDREPLWTSEDTIVFRSNRGGQLDLWQLSISTGRATQLTSSQMVEQATGASSDGAVIAFEQTSSVPSLFSLDLSSGATRQLTGDALGDFWPSIAGNGQQMAFQRAQPTPGEGFQFFDARVLVASAGSGPMRTQVIDDGFAARLSADGTWLAYFQRTAIAQELRVRVKNLSTAEGRILSERGVLPSVSAISPPIDWVDQTLAWSRTGARLYFVVYGAQGHEIRVADLAGREEPSLLVAAPAGARIRDLRMSPSGNAFAYLVRNSDGVEEVYVWDLAAVRPLRVASGKTPRGALSLPGWSSDTAIVLIHSSQRGGSYHLDVSELGLDGRRRTVGQVQDGVIPNAKVDHQRGRLFLSRSTEGAQNLFTMSLADGSMRQVTANESPGISFAGVQPMGDDSILFARDERKRDVWLVQRGPRKP